MSSLSFSVVVSCRDNLSVASPVASPAAAISWWWLVCTRSSLASSKKSAELADCNWFDDGGCSVLGNKKLLKHSSLTVVVYRETFVGMYSSWAYSFPQKEAEKMYDIFSIQKQVLREEICSPCKFCKVRGGSFILTDESEELEQENPNFKCEEGNQTGKESGAAFVFFKNSLAAATVAQARQSTNPMLWVTSLAPEPTDVYWSNLCVPYRQFWMHKATTLVATTTFLLFFIALVALVQSLANLKHFERILPFLKGLLRQLCYIAEEEKVSWF